MTENNSKEGKRMEVEELLPIGSVVRLKGAKKDLMIIGIKVQDTDGNNFDYISVMYPEGYVSRDIFFKFNHENIEEIYFEGYKSDERNQFIDTISKLMDN